MATKTRSKKSGSRKLSEIEKSWRRRHRRRNPLADQLALQHHATIDRIDSLLDGWAWIEPLNGTPHHGDRRFSDDEAACSSLELINITEHAGKIDHRKNSPQQVSEAFGRMIRKLSTLKRRLDRQIATGELPRPNVKRLVLTVAGDVIREFDSAHSAYFMMKEVGGELLYEFEDGSTAPCESGWIESAMKQFAEQEAADAA